MKSRRLGKSLVVSEVGLGCMGMSEFYGAADEAQSVATLHRALELGIDFFDTADMYGMGHNEELVGRALAAVRDQVIIATKFGFVRSKTDPSVRGIDGRPAYIKSACEASLKRLGIDVIDLYYQHRVDNNVPIEESVGAMAELVREGKVRFLGLSEAGADTIRRAHAVHPITALQSEYSLWSRDPEDGTLATCRELGIGFVAYSPLGRGFLSGAIKRIDDLEPDDFRRNNPRFQGENFGKNTAMVGKISEIAHEIGATPSQLAIAWVLAQGDDIVPIPGTKRASYLEQNAGAAAIQLTPEQLRRIDAVAPAGAAAGTRYPDMGAVNR